MDQDRALRHAVISAPDDDLPRLVYADWLDDAGDTARAEFIRGQVQLARTPPWEPFAVHARHHQPSLESGADWRQALPSFGEGKLVEWHAARPFRRGFGWCVQVRQMSAFLEIAPELFALEPVGELVLPAATRDDWEALAASPWLRCVKALRFTTGSSLSEPIRALAGSPYAASLESIAFEVSTSPGMGAVVELLMQSPLAKQLKELEFRIGHDRDGEILLELNRAPALALEKLTLATMGQGHEALGHLTGLPNSQRLKSLSILHQPTGGMVAETLMAGLRVFPLQQFAVLAGQLAGVDVARFAAQSLQRSLQSLNLSENVFEEIDIFAPGDPERFPNLRSLQLRRCGLDDARLPALVAAGFWSNLVELDLRGNRFTDAGARVLLDAAPPREITAFLLPREGLSDESQASLGAQFGPALILE